MAILTRTPGVIVTITSDNRDLPEFENSTYSCSRNTVAKYVEVKTQTEFAVKIVVNKQAMPFGIAGCLLFDVFVDGQMIAKRLFESEVTPSNCCQFVHGKTEGTALYPMRFTDLNITKAGGPLSIERIAQSMVIGEIKVEMRYGKGWNTGIMDAMECTKEIPAFSSIDYMPEEALNGEAISHNVT